MGGSAKLTRGFAVGVAVLTTAAAPWLAPAVQGTATAVVSTREIPQFAQVRPLAFTSAGAVTATWPGRLGLVPQVGGAGSVLARHTGSVDQAWGCGPSFVGLVTAGPGLDWQTSVVWVDTATRATSRTTLPRTQRVLGASPRGFVVADSSSRTTVEVVGGTGARTVVAPYADTWACDTSGYAWSESQPGAWTEKAYRRAWSGVTDPPSLLVESADNLRLLSLSGGVALVSDAHRDAATSRPTSVFLERVTAGVAPVVLWTATDVVLEGAVASGANTYLRVTDRTSGSAAGRTLARDGSGVVRPLSLPIPFLGSPTPLTAIAGGGASIGVGGSAGGLFTLGPSTVVRTATWSYPQRHTRGTRAG